MKYHYTTKNPELTKKALDYISKNGRNEFDEMINELLNKRKSPVKEGWIKRNKNKKRRR